MASIQIDIPNEFYEKMEVLASRAEEAVRLAQVTLELTKTFTGETGTVYTTLSEELKQQRELIEDLRQRVHDLGNKLGGTMSAGVAERFIRQVVTEILDERN